MLNKNAKKSGLFFISELGLDPGLDHMSIMKTLENIYKSNGKIYSLTSLCGGIPIRKDVNYLHYISSWRMEGPLKALKSNVRFIENNRIISAYGRSLFNYTKTWQLDEIGVVESFPNRDSLVYLNEYGLNKENMDTFQRGTIRYPGWSEVMRTFFDMFLLDEEKIDYGEKLSNYVIRKLGVKNLDEVFTKLSVGNYVRDVIDWLEIFNDNNLIYTTPLSTLANIVETKISKPNNTSEDALDLVVMKHFFYYKDGINKNIKKTSTLIFKGNEEYSAMARTVGLPVAITADLILKGKIPNDLAGVKIPTNKALYSQVLSELEKYGITFNEREEEL